jgi:hypothetical protein
MPGGIATPLSSLPLPARSPRPAPARYSNGPRAILAAHTHCNTHAPLPHRTSANPHPACARLSAASARRGQHLQVNPAHNHADPRLGRLEKAERRRGGDRFGGGLLLDQALQFVL